jgi:D-xylose transport system substrate-binding protein
LINDNKYEVPYIKLEPIAVTAQNMDEVIIDSGFHLKEDVYLNVPEEE